MDDGTIPIDPEKDIGHIVPASKAQTTVLWELLLPTGHDKIVMDTALTFVGGITKMPHQVKGLWKNPDGGLIEDVLDVYRIAATREMMQATAIELKNELIEFSVCYYRISDEFRRTAWDEGKDVP